LFIKNNQACAFDQISRIYDDNNCKSPTSLIELTKTEQQRLSKNSIHLTGLSFVKHPSHAHKLARYETIVAGSNVSFCSLKKCNPIYLGRTKKNILVITALKEEILSISPNTIIINSTTTKKSTLSGIVLLLHATQERKTTCQSSFWPQSIVTTINNCKTNILSVKNSHFGSKGHYYSFGNKAMYGMKGTDGKSSVGTYANKKARQLKHQQMINMEAGCIEKAIAKDLGKAVESLSKQIQNLQFAFAPILNIGFEMQKERGQNHLQNVPTTQSGLWQSQLCINAETSVIHTEKDCCYTLISVPNQEFDCNKTAFKFCFNEDNSISLNLVKNVSFIFSGVFLSHKQVRNNLKEKEGVSFFNLASYGNGRLYNHLCKSFERNNNNE
jgi:hypothetical protein